jgi:hypothetical protein
MLDRISALTGDAMNATKTAENHRNDTTHQKLTAVSNAMLYNISRKNISELVTTIS